MTGTRANGRKLERSRAYPVISLGPAVEAIQKIVHDLGSGDHDRSSLTQALGYASPTGLAARKVAALVHFGLLERDKSTYRVTSLADQILHPKDDEERTRAIREAFVRPAVFNELCDKYAAEGKVPRQLSNLLFRDHQISRNAASDVAQVFLESGTYAGVLNEGGWFTNANDGAVVESTPPAPAPAEAPTAPRLTSPPAPEAVTAQDQQRFEIGLSAGRAQLVVPVELNRNDIVKLRKLLELIELDVGGELEGD